MIRRRAALALLLLGVPGSVAAQDAAAAPNRPRRRRNTALPLPPPPPPAAARGEPAPVPDRDLEAPPARDAPAASPRVDPALIDPDNPRAGTPLDRSNPQAREDRLLRQPAPGARLRVTFQF